MTATQVAAVTMWILAAGFGLPTLAVAFHLLRQHELPMFFGLFRAYGGGLFERFPPGVFALLLCAYFALSLLEAYCGVLLWDGSRTGGFLALGLLPVEGAFWLGFALPIPPIFALLRLLFLALGWETLT
jgi:hypothetical protein